MSSLVVVSVSDRGKGLTAVFARVGLFPGVSPHVYLQASAVCEFLLAALDLANEPLLF